MNMNQVQILLNHIDDMFPLTSPNYQIIVVDIQHG